MKRFIIILTILTCLFSCRDLVQDQFPDNKEVVINSILSAEQELKLHLSFTAKMNDTLFKVIENATVRFYKDSLYVENLYYVGDGFYLSSNILEEDHKYSCEVQVPNYGTYYCEDFLPKKQCITNLKHVKIAGITDDGEVFSSVSFTFNNQINERKYYQVVIKEITPYDESFVNLALFTDPILISEGLPILAFSNESISGSSYEMTINYTVTSYSNNLPVFKPIQVEFRSISYNYYQYLKKLYLYEQGINPSIDASPTYTNMHSNIEGAYGIFAGFSTCLTDTIFP